MHTQVVPSPHDGEEYLLKTKGYGVWKSTGGKSWNLVTERFLVDGVFYDEETPGIAYYVKHLQRDDKTWMQLYRSSDGGETWALWQEEEGINPISILMHQGSLYFQNALTGEVCQWPLKENMNDADGIHDVVNGEDIHGESLYDLQGRSVGNGISHLKKGIYIIEGRKTVVR